MEYDRSFTSFTINAQTAEKGEQTYDCNPDNTTLYLHDPERFNEYDHFFRELKGDELPEEYQNSGKLMGGFITRHALGEEEFETTAEAVCNSYNFKVVYLPVPTDSDRLAIDEQMQAILGRELDEMNPEDFA